MVAVIVYFVIGAIMVLWSKTVLISRHEKIRYEALVLIIVGLIWPYVLICTIVDTIKSIHKNKQK